MNNQPSPPSCLKDCPKVRVCKIFIEFEDYLKKNFGDNPPIKAEGLAVLCSEGPAFQLTMSEEIPLPDEKPKPDLNSLEVQ